MHWPVLLLGAGDLYRFAPLVQLDHKIGQAELLMIWTLAANGGLDMSDLLLLQGRIRILPSMTAIRIQLVQIRALLQIGEGFRQQMAVRGVIGSHLHFGNKLQRIPWVAGLRYVGNIALIAFAALLPIGG